MTLLCLVTSIIVHCAVLVDFLILYKPAHLQNASVDSGFPFNHSLMTDCMPEQDYSFSTNYFYIVQRILFIFVMLQSSRFDKIHIDYLLKLQCSEPGLKIASNLLIYFLHDVFIQPVGLQASPQLLFIRGHCDICHEQEDGTKHFYNKS